MRVTVSASIFKSVYGMLLLGACQGAVVDSDKQDVIESAQPASAVDDVSASPTVVPNSNDMGVSGAAASKPFVAILKRPEPVPEALSTGVLRIADNCLTVRIKSQPAKLYTAVLPKNYKLVVDAPDGAFVEIGKRRIGLERETTIPGGAIFVDVNEDVAETIPASCPSDLFGVGE